MYDIGNIILGTYLPWSEDDERQVMRAHVAADLDRYRQRQTDGEVESDEDLLAAAEQGEVEEVFDQAPWNKEYHGGAPSTTAWVGVRLGTIDVTDHIPVAAVDKRPTPKQLEEAWKAYESLPSTVRKLLPPFGTYVVWSSS